MNIAPHRQGKQIVTQPTTPVPIAAEPTTLDYIKALGEFATTATVLIVFLTVILVVTAVARRWFEINFSWGKFSFKVQRPSAPTPLPPIIVAPAVEGSVEDAPTTAAQEVIAQTGTPPEAEDEVERSDFMAYFLAKTLTALDQAFPTFSSTIGEESEEFWETDYRQRRAQYGADNGRDAVRQLIVDHPTWAYPHAVLLQWSIDDHDLSRAGEHLAAGLKRQSSPQFGYVLSAGVKLRFLTGGSRSALSLCAEWSTAAIPERIKAGAFITLADLLKDAGDVEGQRVALEWAITLFPQHESQTFNLAYSYGEIPGRWASSMWHYRRIVGPDDNGPVARNNLGVLLAHFDKRVQIETYEQAAEGGDRYATANIAHLLIADGYIRLAERLLTGVTDPGAAAELHGTAATSAMAARRTLNTRRSEIEQLVDQESEAFRHSVSAAFRHLQSGSPPAIGAYSSADALTVVLIEPGRALCRIRAGSTDFEGILKYQGTCFAGAVLSQGQTILGSFSQNATLLEEGNGVVRLFRWANATGATFTSTETELRFVERLPPPPPPIVTPPPTLPFSGAGLLALGQRPVSGERS